MDFIFDRIAAGHMIKCLTVMDDATHESVASARHGPWIGSARNAGSRQSSRSGGGNTTQEAPEWTDVRKVEAEKALTMAVRL